MLDKIFRMFGKAASNQTNSSAADQEGSLQEAMTAVMHDAGSLPESVAAVMRQATYQEAHMNFPEKLFANPIRIIESISKGSAPEFRNWTKRTLRTGKTAYLTKYPDFPIRSDQAQAGVGAIVFDPADPSNLEYFVMNVGSDFGPTVRKSFLDEDGGLCSVQDGSGCDNNIEAFFNLLDSGKSGMEREREEFRKRLEAQGVKFNGEVNQESKQAGDGDA